MSRLADQAQIHNLRQATKDAIGKETSRRSGSKAAQAWKHAAGLAIQWARSKAHYQVPMNIAMTEHMSGVDVYDGHEARTGNKSIREEEGDEDLLVVSPAIDGRLKDEGRVQAG
jgi:hypothetical protein